MLNINPITKSQLDATLRNVADEVDRSVSRWKRFADFLLTLTADDLTALGYDATARDYIGSLRVALLNMQEAYTNTTKTGTADPSYFVRLFSGPIIF
jgi:hypothetical protein